MRYWLAIFALLISGCSSNHYVSNENLSQLYDYEQKHQPKAKVFYKTPDNPQLIAQVPKNLLTPKNDPQTDEKTYSVRLRYRIYQNYEFPQVLDSQSVQLKGKELKDQTFLEHEFKLPPVEKRYLIVLEIQDLVAQEKTKAFSYYYPYPSSGGQQIKAQTPNGYYFIRPYAAPEDTISLSHSENTRTLVGNRYSSSQMEVAPPPFIREYRNRTLENLRKDSSFTVDTKTPFTLKNDGLFTFAKGVNNANSLNLLGVNKHFPEVNRISQLIKGLIYLTPSETFNQMMNSKASKEVVDSFWLNRAGGNKKRAKRLIQHYYNGMEQANAHFTTYKKGWKTDRGMIYMIFGEPYMVYRDNDRETWIYPQGENFPELKFQFYRRSHPLCREYYELKRNEYYREFWFRAVEKWRNGDIRTQQKH